MRKKTFLLSVVSAILFLLTSFVYAGPSGKKDDAAGLKNKHSRSYPDFKLTYSDSHGRKDFSYMMPEYALGNAKNNLKNVSMRHDRLSFPGRGPKTWGVNPDKPGYSHFSKRPHAGNPPFAPVAPEPVSSILFITGATFLAGRRYLKSKK